MNNNIFILTTAVCTSVVFTLMKYFSSRKQNETKGTLIPKISGRWWSSVDKMMSISSHAIKPYEVSFSQQVVKDLQNRLNSTRLDHSKNYNSLQKIVDYWKNDYDFQTRERYINKYMHFTTNIEGLDIHFIHVKPTTSYGQKKILPLLMLHGWPSSILEFYKIIPLLITPRKDYDFVFEVIIPSLPGFGYSAAPTAEDFSCTDMYMILINLMLRVGHNQFYVQGSDWNAFIARNMSELFSEHVLGIYTSISAPLNKDINLLYSSLVQQLNKQEISKLKLNEEFLQNQTLAIGRRCIRILYNNIKTRWTNILTSLPKDGAQFTRQDFLSRQGAQRRNNNIHVYLI